MTKEECESVVSRSKKGDLVPDCEVAPFEDEYAVKVPSEPLVVEVSYEPPPHAVEVSYEPPPAVRVTSQESPFANRNEPMDSLVEWGYILIFVFLLWGIKNIIRRRKNIATKIEDAAVSAAVSVSATKDRLKDKYHAKMMEAKQCKEEAANES